MVLPIEARWRRDRLLDVEPSRYSTRHVLNRMEGFSCSCLAVSRSDYKFLAIALFRLISVLFRRRTEKPAPSLQLTSTMEQIEDGGRGWQQLIISSYG